MKLKSTLSVIYKDDQILVINKPACIHSASLEETGDAQASIAGLLREEFPECRDASERPEDGGLINRLDFETSGFLIAARNPECWRALRTMIQNQELSKSYIAVVEGILEGAHYLKNFIGSPNRRAQKVRVSDKKHDRYLEAESEFIGIKQIQTHNLTVAKIIAHRARRHQVRAHAAHLGHPLLGDTLYGSKVELATLLGKVENAPAFLLHAGSLEFEHPISLKKLSFHVEPPEEFWGWLPKV